MKKILTVVTTLMLLLVLPVLSFGEKSHYKVKNYPFSHIKSVTISSITAQAYSDPTYRADFNLNEKVSQALKEALQNRNFKITDVAGMGGNSAVNIAVHVEGLGVFTVHEDPYDETRTVNKKTVATDEHGKDVVVYVPTQEVVHHPAADIPHAVAILSFKVTDKLTGKEIFTLRDSRERNDETDTSGMLGRICRDFAKDLTKN